VPRPEGVKQVWSDGAYVLVGDQKRQFRKCDECDNRTINRVMRLDKVRRCDACRKKWLANRPQDDPADSPEKTCPQCGGKHRRRKATYCSRKCVLAGNYAKEKRRRQLSHTTDEHVRPENLERVTAMRLFVERAMALGRQKCDEKGMKKTPHNILRVGVTEIRKQGEDVRLEAVVEKAVSGQPDLF
jgi:hypothetical protein